MVKIHFFALVLVVFFPGIINGQTVELKTVSSSGASNSNTSINIAWTLGETVYTSGSNNNISLTAGFIQTDTNTTISIKKLKERNGIVIFPNPTSGVLTIDIKNASNDTHTVELISVEGKIVVKSLIHHSQEIDITSVKPGIYLLKIIDESDQEYSFYKIIKTD